MVVLVLNISVETFITTCNDVTGSTVADNRTDGDRIGNKIAESREETVCEMIVAEGITMTDGDTSTGGGEDDKTIIGEDADTDCVRTIVAFSTINNHCCHHIFTHAL